MKKFLVAMMALCAVTMGFTSCEKKADPATQPIAGHTYRCTVTENEMTNFIPSSRFTPTSNVPMKVWFHPQRRSKNKIFWCGKWQAK